MTIEPFFAPPENLHGDRILLSQEERRHLVTVTRHHTGDAVTIIDGQGNVYTATIERIGREDVECVILSHTVQRESFHIVIGVGVLKNPARFDFLVEKATELGVREIVPLVTERTMTNRVKSEHWERLALAAVKQSGRAILPTLLPLTSLKEFVRRKKENSLAIIPHEKISVPLLFDVVQHDSRPFVRICIGPEGGFSDAELQEAVEAGFQPVSLGPHRLRTETAAVAAMTFCAAGRDIERQREHGEE